MEKQGKTKQRSLPSGIDIGGQAVIEGVMMKNKENLVIAVRLENGEIKIKKEKLKPLNKIFKLPFIRGIIILFQVLIIGIKALVWSANQNLGKEEELSTFELVSTLAVSLLFAVAFFVGVPFLVTSLFGLKGFWFNLIEGLIRIVLFILYVLIISFLKEIKRMFQYHGAEHMAANCYEAGEELEINNIRKYSTIHPRCGTSFIMLVLIISILVFSLIPFKEWYYNALGRIVLIPVIAGISYEVLRLAGKFRKSTLMNVIIYPGKLLQKITTQKPTDDMIEVAVVALKNVVN